MDTSNWINLGILMVTALVGILAWLGSRHAAREAREDQKAANIAADRSASAAVEANKIQARLVEIEEQRHQQATLQARKAILKAQIISKDQKGWPFHDWFLVVTNSGHAHAHNLEITLDGESIDVHESVKTHKPVSQMSLGPGADLKFQLSLAHDRAPQWECKLSWDDDSGERGHWEGTLT